MAAVKLTISLPEKIAKRFLRLVPPRERSKYLAAALEHSLSLRDKELIKSCRLANEDPEVAEIEGEMEALNDPIEEPWDDSPTR